MGRFFIVDKPYKNMLNPRNGKTASEEKGVLRQIGKPGAKEIEGSAKR
jgi:hypothetical protein